MDRRLREVLLEQSTLTAFILAVILILVAEAAGVNVVSGLGRLKEVLVGLAGVALAAKVLLPDTPVVPRSSVVITPPVNPHTAEAAGEAVAEQLRNPPR